MIRTAARSFTQPTIQNAPLSEAYWRAKRPQRPTPMGHCRLARRTRSFRPLLARMTCRRFAVGAFLPFDLVDAATWRKRLRNAAPGSLLRCLSPRSSGTHAVPCLRSERHGEISIDPRRPNFATPFALSLRKDGL